AATFSHSAYWQPSDPQEACDHQKEGQEIHHTIRLICQKLSKLESIGNRVCRRFKGQIKSQQWLNQHQGNKAHAPQWLAGAQHQEVQGDADVQQPYSAGITHGISTTNRKVTCKEQ
ncbi:hypothetical protein J0S82_000921, partial [Galemys pyrenaicus]